MQMQLNSGGQTGADQAAWKVAKGFGVRSSGRMPKGFLTGDAPWPEFAEEHATEGVTESLVAPNEQDLRDSDATVWFGATTTTGAQETVGFCQKFDKPCMLIYPGASFEPSHVAAWIAENKIHTLNVAGNSEAVEPRIGERVERFLGKILLQLGHLRT
jgi:hypothetical protein